MKTFIRSLLLSWASLSSFEFAPTIPQFDLIEFENAQNKSEYIQVIQDALHRVGFIAFTNTGIDNSVIKQAFASAKEFFALDVQTKMKYYSLESNCQRGYIPLNTEIAKGSKIFDYKEFFHLGRNWSEEELERLGYLPNIWPEESSLEASFQAYLTILESLMVRIGSVLSLCLEEDVDYLDKMTKEGSSILRVIHYPPMEVHPNETEIFWSAEHSDINLFTILPEATSEGLEVKLEDGTWVPVYAKNDSIIVNLGDFTEILANGYFPSSKHRVRAPKAGIERYSIVYFTSSRNDEIFTPLPQWIKRRDNQSYFASASKKELFLERMADNNQISPEGLIELAQSGVMERLIEVNRASYDAMVRLRNAKLASESVLKKLAEIECEE